MMYGMSYRSRQTYLSFSVQHPMAKSPLYLTSFLLASLLPYISIGRENLVLDHFPLLLLSHLLLYSSGLLSWAQYWPEVPLKVISTDTYISLPNSSTFQCFQCPFVGVCSELFSTLIPVEDSAQLQYVIFSKRPKDACLICSLEHIVTYDNEIHCRFRGSAYLLCVTASNIKQGPLFIQSCFHLQYLG